MASQLQERPDIPAKVVDALERGEREEAIVGLQRERNLTREDARDLVASYILLTPGMRMKDTQSETRWGFVRWLMLFQVIVVTIGYFMFFHGKY